MPRGRSDSSSSSRARRATLRLLAPPMRPARAPYVPSSRMPRRPGERREPLTLPGLPPGLTTAAARYGLDVGCVAELCLERSLLVRDLRELGRSAMYPRLIETAAVTGIRRALPAARARYIQMLLAATHRGPSGAEREPATTDVVIDVPLRLFPRVLDVVADTAFEPTEVRDALKFEIAAASEGRSMSEWAALTTLRLSP
jgi:hypothetical protein